MAGVAEALNPRSIAVIGASRNPEKIGYVVLKQLSSKFRGRLYPINPSADEILGLKCYKSILEVPDEVDLAVIAVPADHVIGVIRECGAKKVKAAVVLTSGFSEVGNRELEEKLVEEAKKGGVRIIGPNCMGVFDPGRGIDMLFVKEELLPRCKPGSIALLSQSGSVGTNMISMLRKMNLGISTFVSYGNKADVDEADLLDVLAEDERTKAIAIYLEGVKDGRRLMSAIKRTEKPVIVLKVGRSEAGERAVASHTGSLAGSSRLYIAALRQAGAVIVDSMEELIDASKALSMQPPVTGKRVFIVTNGGGYGIMAVDELERRGMIVPKTPDEIKYVFKGKFPPYYSLDNPIDLTANSTPEQYGMVLRTLCNSDACDAILVIPLMGIPNFDPIEVAEVISSIEFKKPVVASFVSHTEETDRAKEIMEKAGIPVYESPERAARAIYFLYEYGRSHSG
ncbi:MAG: acetate--CoA ligase family protein [Candidatus Methanodesulfokora sp.]